MGSATERREMGQPRHWLSQISSNIRLTKLKLRTQLRRKPVVKVDSLSRLDQIPEDWQNTLVRNYPSLRRSNSSTSSFTSSRSTGSNGSGSSAYSVNDFLRDLSVGESLDKTSKTSTPFTCHILPLNRMEKLSSPSLLLHHGLKIYEDQTEEHPARQLRTTQTFLDQPQEDLYENGSFHQGLEEECRRMNQEDQEDGYEIIVIKNAERKRSNCRTLKQNLKN